jgi:phosphatidate cytidylyltransferase
MSFGKTKLFERHSPKKTWEGFFGGMALSILAALILGHYFQGIHTWQWVISSILIVVFGTYGDLSESMLKRSYQIKDSGNILPGHGGLLDRFDGLLLAAPLVYTFLSLTM